MDYDAKELADEILRRASRQKVPEIQSAMLEYTLNRPHTFVSQDEAVEILKARGVFSEEMSHEYIRVQVQRAIPVLIRKIKKYNSLQDDNPEYGDIAIEREFGKGFRLTIRKPTPKHPYQSFTDDIASYVLPLFSTGDETLSTEEISFRLKLRHSFTPTLGTLDRLLTTPQKRYDGTAVETVATSPVALYRPVKRLYERLTPK